MKCPICGIDNRDGARFCAICGAPIDTAASAQTGPQFVMPEEQPIAPAPQPIAEEPTDQPPQDEPIREMPAFEFPEEQPPQKTHKGLLIALGSVAAVLVFCVVSWFGNLFGLRDGITEMCVKTFGSSETQLQYSYSKLATDTGSTVLQTIASSATVSEDGRAVSYTYTLTGGEALSQLNASEVGMDLSSLENATLKLSGELLTEGDLTGMTMTLSDGSNTLLSGNVYLDAKSNTLTVSLPELTDEVLKYDLPASAVASNPYSTLTSNADAAELAAMVQKMLPEEAVNELLSGCIEAALLSIENVETETATYEAAGVRETATKMSLPLNGKNVSGMLLAVVSYLEESETLHDLLINAHRTAEEYLREQGVLENGVMPTTAEEYANEFFEELRAARKELSENPAKYEQMYHTDGLYWNTYLDDDCEILAIELTNGQTRLFVGGAENDDTYGLEASYKTQSTVSKITLYGREDDDFFQGTVTVESEGKQLATVAIEDLDLEILEATGQFNGTLTLRSSFLPNGYALRLVSDSNHPEQIFLDLSMLFNDSALVTLNLTAEDTAFTDLTVPTATTLDPDDFAESIDQEALITDLQKNEILNKMVSLFTLAAVSQSPQFYPYDPYNPDLHYYTYDNYNGTLPDVYNYY